MANPPFMLLFAAGVGLAALIYYYFKTPESPEGYKTEGRRSSFRLDSDECSICQEMIFPSGKRTLRCGHQFHARCFNKWAQISTSCPNCRSPV